MNSVARRDFIEATSIILAGLLTGCASMVTTRVTPERGVARLPLRNYPDLDRAGGFLRILPEGSPTPLYVVSLENGRYLTLSPICKHLGCVVDLEGSQFVCPCHGSTYAMDGRVLKGPTQLPLDSFPTRVVDGMLVIELEGAS